MKTLNKEQIIKILKKKLNVTSNTGRTFIEITGIGESADEILSLLPSDEKTTIKKIAQLIANHANTPYCWEDIMNRLKNGDELPFKMV